MMNKDKAKRISLLVAVVGILLVPTTAQADHLPDAPTVTDLAFEPGHGPQ